jgi:hypothetical protein
MAGVSPRNSPFSPFSVNPRPEIPRSPFRGTGFRGKDAGAGGRLTSGAIRCSCVMATRGLLELKETVR